MTERDDDAAIRSAVFAHLRRLHELHDTLTSEHLKAGFVWRGERLPLINPQRGIFKPRQMLYLLSIRTVFPRSGAKVWYDDQRRVHAQIYAGEESVDYAFMGQDADAADNVWLKRAWEERVPIVYFLGIAPSRYQAIVPTFVSGWSAQTKTAKLAFALPGERDVAKDAPERRYALRIVQQRLHQASFRAAVISAYGGRCALSGLPEPMLLDAAHIVDDGHEAFGQPVVPNGLPLSKIHHAAFDAHLIGIDPGFRVHVAERLRVQTDGPMLEALKALHLRSVHVPVRARDMPDRDRLAQRFEMFEMADENR